MNQDKQSEVIERLRSLAERQRQARGDYMDYGKPDPEILEAIEALSRPSLSTPSEGVIERVGEALENLLNAIPASEYGRLGIEQEVLAATCALARLSPLPLVEDKS